jgi:hypothetical protein
MALDLQKLREKLAILKDPKSGRRGGKDRKTWSPDATKVNTVRMIQYPHSEDPFVELHFHYGIGEGPGIMCSRMNEGTTCSICEFGFSLYKDGDKETAKKMFPRARYYSPMVDRSEETPIVRYWGFGKEIYQYLIESLLSEDYGAFLDPKNGLDAEVRQEKRGDATYLRSVLTFKRRETPLAGSPQEIKDLINSIQPVDMIFRPSTKPEIEARLSGWLKLTDQDGGETRMNSSGVASEVSEPTSPTETPMEDLAAAFDRAMSEG